jgi:hypothetical protein
MIRTWAHGLVAMSEKFESVAILECYRRAAEARRFADDAVNSFEKADFLDIERRWKSLAYSDKSEDAFKAGPRDKKPRTGIAGVKSLLDAVLPMTGSVCSFGLPF